jgi:hypothetical protein
MVCAVVEKVKGDFPEYRKGDKSKYACDASIVDSEPENQHEKHHPSEREFYNVVGYVDL